MELSLRRWKRGQLLLAWAAYWAGLIGVTLGPALRATWRATQLPEGHGTVSASFGDAGLTYTVVEEGVKTINVSAPASTVLLWVVGPPLLLWLVWLIVRERPGARRHGVAGGSSGREALGPGSPPANEWRSRQREHIRVEPERVNTPNP